MRGFVSLGLVLLLAGVVYGAEDLSAAQDFDEKWNYGDPAATEQAFRAFLPKAPERGADYHAQLLTQIARTYSLRRKFDDAHKLLDEAKQVLGDGEGVARVRWRLERGRSFNSAGKRDEATAQFKLALAAAEKLKADFYVVDALHMLGISEPPEKALAWNLKAIKAAEASKSERAKGWLGALYNNTGWTYFEAKKYETALLYFRSNAAFRQERKRDDRIAQYCVGKALRMLEQYEEAFKIQRDLETRYAKEGKPDGFVFEELGELLWATGEKAAAKPYFVKAHAELSKISWMKSEKERMASIRKRAGLDAPADEDAKQNDAAPKADR